MRKQNHAETISTRRKKSPDGRHMGEGKKTMGEPPANQENREPNTTERFEQLVAWCRQEKINEIARRIQHD